MADNVEFLSCQRILSLMTILCFVLHEVARSQITITIIEIAADYKWSEKEKNDVLGSFFWGYMLTAIPGGRLSEIYGTKIVIGISMLVTSLLTLLTPIACYLNYYCVIAVRVGLGLALGVQWPAMSPMASRWFTEANISKFLANRIAMTLGSAVGLPLYGYMTAYLGWKSVNYVSSVTVLIWTLFWFYLIYDSPQQHPRISTAEKCTLQDEVKEFYTQEIPWRKIFSSGPVWAFIIANIGLFFLIFTISLQTSIYLDAMFHINIEHNGILSSLPFLGRYITSIIVSFIADKLQKERTFSTTTIRKFFTTMGFGGNIILLIILSLWGYNRSVSITSLIFFGWFLGVPTGGFFSNTNDLSPAYCGTIFGIGNMISAPAGYLSTKMVTWLVENPSDFEQWRCLFWILIGIAFISTIFFLVFGSGELLEWNPKRDSMETVKLKQDETKPKSNIHSDP